MTASELLNSVDFLRYQKQVNKMRLISCNVVDGELHHIIPRSLGGDNDPNNLVRVSRQNHKYLHVVLSECFEAYDPNCDWAKKMKFAMEKMHGKHLSTKQKKRKKLRPKPTKRVQQGEVHKLKQRIMVLEKQLEESLKYIADLEGF